MTEKEKITIKGTPSAWDQKVYESKLEGWINVYRGTEQSMELVKANFEHELIQAVIDKSRVGYTVAVNKHVYHGPLEHSVWMVKPESQQAEDIAAITVNVKNEYIAHLESERASYQDKLRKQLIQTQREKEQKAQRDKEAKQLAEIERQVQECYAPLAIPE
ncbi:MULTISPECIES: hypothetical protein [unclassified Pseudomonas]|uniref:hypothetical protein n=1 Tax=unclassified Pseudomonas TaxID=196821 RepID=UPI00224AAD9F|nr:MULTISPECIES: hypothetical protein [unclassified Pseudomonas]MCX2814570.1 hypothetical protein [Pseudomonas sp. DCB_E]MCX9143949.1 hypothetical protein [Pseudomonas sp. DCB_Q]